MLFRLLLLLTIIPTVELMLLLWIAQHTSIGFTFALVVVTGVIGAYLARWQGVAAIRRIEEELDHRRMPADAIFDGALILVAGVLLITPGVMTDASGLLLLFPPTRRLVKAWLRHYWKGHFTVHRYRRDGYIPEDRPSDHDQIIEGKVVEASPGEDA